jgi:cytochrome c oxidase cbb3-type subunit III
MRFPAIVTALFALSLIAGCHAAPGYPKADEQPLRPQDQLDFRKLYAQNCAACHGADGTHGPAYPLANPAYQAIVDDASLKKWISSGMPGTQMPAFAQAAGGMLTDQQVDVLVAGMRSAWSKGGALGGLTAPAYLQGDAGDAAKGKQLYASACSRCHQQTSQQVADPNFLGLISDQALRTIIVAGRPDIGHPDWRGDLLNQPLTAQDVTDLVTYLHAAREQAPEPPAVKP